MIAKKTLQRFEPNRFGTTALGVITLSLVLELFLLPTISLAQIPWHTVPRPSRGTASTTGTTTPATDTAATPGDTAKQATSENIKWTECTNAQQTDCIAPNSIIDAFEGWNHSFQAEARSPILFDPRETTVRQRMYPQMKKERGLRDLYKDTDEINLTTDDEVLKTKMAIYQPIGELQKFFAKDDKARDDHLDLFSTVRGVAILTLSYLDKTVAAGLASVQQQADEDTTEHILKQISWTSSQLANPHRNQLYVDVDEKVEACMAKLMGEGRFTEFTEESCKEQCAPAETGGGGAQSEVGPGHNRYCVCCAEVATKINPTDEGKISAGAGTADQSYKRWSLAKRGFWGVQVPTDIADKITTTNGPLTDREKKRFIKEYVRMFRGMYGDIVLRPKQVDQNASGDERTKDALRFSYIYPSYSVPEFIELLEIGPAAFNQKQKDAAGVDKCQDPPLDTEPTATVPAVPGTSRLAGDDADELGGNIIYCPITQEQLKYGICPSLKYLIDPKQWPDLVDKDGKKYSGPPWYPPVDVSDTANPAGSTTPGTSTEDLRDSEELLEVWVEASLGMMISARDIMNIRKMAMDDPGRALRWIDAYCDASAAAAFKKLHARMKSIAADHLAMNLRATEKDKEQLRRLMSRVDEYLALSELDIGSRTEPEMLLVGISVERDRTDISDQQLAQSSMTASHMTMQKVQDLQFFGLGRAHVLGFLRNHSGAGGVKPGNRPGGGR